MNTRLRTRSTAVQIDHVKYLRLGSTAAQERTCQIFEGLHGRGSYVPIVQVAQNPLKFGMPTLVFVFQEGRIWSKLCEHPPPSPSLSVSLSKHCRISIPENKNSVHVCVLHHWRAWGGGGRGGGGGGEGGKGGGVGGLFKSVFGALLHHFWKKNRIFLTQKESACQISADSEQLEKLHTPPFHKALHLYRDIAAQQHKIEHAKYL